MFLLIVTIYATILHILKIIHLLFKPKFLSVERFGPPSKFMLLVYYLFILFFIIVLMLDSLGFIQIEIKQSSITPTFRYEKGLIYTLFIGILAATIHVIIDYKSRRKKAN